MALNGGNDIGNPRPPRRGASRSERLQYLYQLSTGRDGRADRQRPSRLTTPMVVGSGVVLGLLGALLLGIVLAVQAAVAGFDSLTQDLPSVSNINNAASFKTAQIFDRNGQLLWEFNDPDGGRRMVVPLNQISQHLIDASLAAEDAFFYQHNGVDLRATLRSAFLTGSGESLTGASTITQQLVRNVILSPEEAHEVTISRKLREILLSYQLEQKLSKDQILELYLNQVFYGNNSYGIEAASETYFDEDAKDLDLAQAALLAGLVQSPSAYDPTRTDLPRTADGIPIPTKERQAYVLEQMARHGFISQDDAIAAYREPLTIKQREIDLKSPHWVMYIRDLVEQEYGSKELYQGGLKIYTTLDENLNEQMQQVLLDNRQNVINNHGDNSALIAVDPKTGEILSFIGSMDYNDDSIDGQVNVLLSERQPGSAIKPVVYGLAFQKGESPGTFVDDEATCWEDAPGHQWCPTNFDNEFHGMTTLRSAFGNSLNIPAIKTLEFDGVENVRELGEQMGITTWGPDSGKTFGLSLTLGGAEVLPIDLAQVYANYANDGLKIPLVAITRIVDADGNVLEDYKVPQGDQVIDPRAAYMVTNVLTDPAAKLITYGFNTPLVFGDRPDAAKTGTTDHARDTWTAGYVPSLAMVVWVGNSDGSPMGDALSSMTAGIIWPEAMHKAIDTLNIPPEDFPEPDGLVTRQVCGDTRMRPGQPICRDDLFLAESAPDGTVSAPAGAPGLSNGAATAPVPLPASAPAPASGSSSSVAASAPAAQPTAAPTARPAAPTRSSAAATPKPQATSVPPAPTPAARPPTSAPVQAAPPTPVQQAQAVPVSQPAQPTSAQPIGLPPPPPAP